MNTPQQSLAIKLPSERPAGGFIYATITFRGKYPHGEVMWKTSDSERQLETFWGGLRYTLDDCIREIRERWSVEPEIKKARE